MREFIFWKDGYMMTSSNGNIFRVTGHLCGEFTGPGEFPAQRPVMRSFDVFFDLRLNKRLSKQSWGWRFEMLSRPLWRHRNDIETSPRPLLLTVSSYTKFKFKYLYCPLFIECLVPISLVPHLIGPPTHQSPISLVPQCNPVYIVLIGPPYHWSPSLTLSTLFSLVPPL